MLWTCSRQQQDLNLRESITAFLGLECVDGLSFKIEEPLFFGVSVREPFFPSPVSPVPVDFDMVVRVRLFEEVHIVLFLRRPILFNAWKALAVKAVEEFRIFP